MRPIGAVRRAARRRPNQSSGPLYSTFPCSIQTCVRGGGPEGGGLGSSARRHTNRHTTRPAALGPHPLSTLLWPTVFVGQHQQQRNSGSGLARAGRRPTTAGGDARQELQHVLDAREKTKKRRKDRNGKNSTYAQKQAFQPSGRSMSLASPVSTAGTPDVGEAGENAQSKKRVVRWALTRALPCEKDDAPRTPCARRCRRRCNHAAFDGGPRTKGAPQTRTAAGARGR